MLLIRADASVPGHEGFRRLLYLAQLLKERTPVCFRVQAEKSVVKALAERRIPHIAPDEEIDWEKTVAVLFDLPLFTARDLNLLDDAKKAGRKTVQFAEAGAAPQGADLVLDFFAEPALMPLHQRFRHFQRLTRKYRRRPREVFLSLGEGADYRTIKEVVDRIRRARLQVKIAPPASFKKAYAKVLRRLGSGIRFVGKPECLARSFFEADIAVVMAGQRSYEAAACGTPALYFAAEPKQRSVAESFAAAGAGVYVGDLSVVAHGKWLDDLTALTFEQRLQMGKMGKTLVDGLGVHRVLALLKENGIIL